MSFAISGATTRGASDSTSRSATGNDGAGNPVTQQLSASFYVSGLTAGGNTFTPQYKSEAANCTFSNRSIVVQPF